MSITAAETNFGIFDGCMLSGKKPELLKQNCTSSFALSEALYIAYKKGDKFKNSWRKYPFFIHIIKCVLLASRGRRKR